MENQENDFFKNRIKDILNMLDKDYESITDINEKIPLTNELKVDFNDLKININTLYQKQENTVENNKNDVKDDLGWFYEKEPEEVSKKK